MTSSACSAASRPLADSAGSAADNRSTARVPMMARRATAASRSHVGGAVKAPDQGVDFGCR